MSNENAIEVLNPDNLTGAVAVQKRGYEASPLAMLTDEEFATRLAQASSEIDRLEQLQIAIMKDGIDYGAIPGTDKKTLFQPGAQKLNRFARLTPEYDITRHEGDGISRPTVAYIVRCRLINADEAIIGEGYGAANTWEKKHRYRYNDRSCPECGGAFIRRSGAQDEYDWYCWRRQGGCGAQFLPGRASVAIESQPLMVENPDPYDLDNTCVKMANKRAFVAATVQAHACSGQFSQDAPSGEEPARADVDKPLHSAAAQGATVRKEEKPAPARDHPGEGISEGRVKHLYGKLKGRFVELGYDWTADSKHIAISEVLADVGVNADKFEGLTVQQFDAARDVIAEWVKAGATDTGQA
jgi:hypothetical protein